MSFAPVEIAVGFVEEPAQNPLCRYLYKYVNRRGHGLGCPKTDVFAPCVLLDFGTLFDNNRNSRL